MGNASVRTVIVGRLSEIHTDYVSIGRGGATRIALPPGFSVEHLHEGTNVTVVTALRDGQAVAERIWECPTDG